METNIMLTIFTPTFNRANLLDRCYKSLKRQTSKCFIWLIVDDGSSDNTRQVVCDWIKQENDFEIVYIFKENGGMHTAHNYAYQNITTELCTNLDSDDYMPDDAVEFICNFWKEKGSTQYAGIFGLDADFNGNIIGSKFPQYMTSTKCYDFIEKYGRGDKKAIYRTDVMKSYPPYPEFPGEKYGSMGYKSLLIDQDYKMLTINKILCFVEYQANGSTNNMLSQYYYNPNGFKVWRILEMKYAQTFKRKYISCIHFVSSCLLLKNKDIFKNPLSKIATLGALLPGIVLTVFIVVNVKCKELFKGDTENDGQ